MAEEAQRGPRGRGAVQPQVQGNVQSELARQNQEAREAAREEADRVLNTPEANTDTDKWLRLISLQVDRMANSLGPSNTGNITVRSVRSDLDRIIDRLNELAR